MLRKEFQQVIAIYLEPASKAVTFSDKKIFNPTNALWTKLDSLLSLNLPTNLDFDSYYSYETKLLLRRIDGAIQELLTKPPWEWRPLNMDSCLLFICKRTIQHGTQHQGLLLLPISECITWKVFNFKCSKNTQKIDLSPCRTFNPSNKAADS